MKRLLSVMGVAIALGCAPAEEAAPAKPAMDIYSVSWNVTQAEISAVKSVADIDEAIVFFRETSAAVMVDGEIQGESASAGPFRSSAAIPSADGSSEWIVGIDAQGRVLRVKIHDASLENVSGRYGLEGVDVQAVVAIDAETVAFLIADGIVVADGVKVRHWQIGPGKHLAPGPRKLALVGDADVRVFDIATSSLTRYPVKAPKAAAFDAKGRLNVASGSAIYREQNGKLVVAHEATAEVHSLSRGGQYIWFGAGTFLGVIDETGVVATSVKPLITTATTLIPSSSGDVWAITDGYVMRYGASGASSGAALTWEKEVKPIFEENCASCHMPGGLAGIDLSTFESWNVTRTNIMRRVIVERSMPPKTAKALSEEDREKIRGWLTGQSDGDQ